MNNAPANYLSHANISVSRRGVVFFRKQDDLDNELQKVLGQRLGELSGKPSTSKLHIHPVSNSGRRLGGKDDQISVISSEQAKELYSDLFIKKQSGKEGWHSDITFEPVPSDYAILRLTELPKTGGDTLWASGYEVYDRISPAYQKFLEGLTATYAQPVFTDSAQRNNFSLYSGERGAPENTGTDLKAIHPVVRTNPVRLHIHHHSPSSLTHTFSLSPSLNPSPFLLVPSLSLNIETHPDLLQQRNRSPAGNPSSPSVTTRNRSTTCTRPRATTCSSGSCS